MQVAIVHSNPGGRQVTKILSIGESTVKTKLMRQYRCANAKTQRTAVGGGTQMIHREDFIDAMGKPDKHFTSAVDAALLQLKEMEAKLVRKE